MVTYSLKEYIRLKGYNSVSKQVLENTNGYPFLSFLYKQGDKTVCDNIYFSVNMSKSVGAGQVVDSDLLSQIRVVETENAAGEFRVKLGGIGESRYADLADLL